MNGEVKEITKRNVDFGSWYTDVCLKADLIDYTSVKGSMIIRPYGYSIWEQIVSILDGKFKKEGVQNVQMPMFIPEDLFNKEKEHVKGFAPEVAYVTQGGDEKLPQRMIVRPTSEVLFCEHFKKRISSYKDLPLIYNQWCTIVRWEKTTRPFLRSREILWQEGHTMHATADEAIVETKKMLKIYEDFQKNILALPVIIGRKTEKEKFAGAVSTYTLEAMMQNGVALQNGTSHYFGDGFAKAFDIKYIDKNNKYVYPFQTSWGVSTRMIGAVIMTHSDDRGLVLPPNIAPIKVAIIPINDKVYDECDKIKDNLEKGNISCIVDKSLKSAGFKFAEAEVRGYPLRIEVGPRDLEKNIISIVRRDTLEKIDVNVNSYESTVKNLLDDIQNSLYNEALKRRDSMIYNVDLLEDLESLSKEKQGFFIVPWCEDEACEKTMKESLGLTSRCLLDENEVFDGKCIICGKQAKKHLYISKQY
ncbi:MAG: proline--tRNA ligase [Bacilli bacterium]